MSVEKEQALSGEGLVGRCVLVRGGYPDYSLIDVTRETPKLIYGKRRGDSWRREDQFRKDRIAKIDGTEADLQQLVSAKAESDRRRRAALEWYSTRCAEILQAHSQQPNAPEVEK